MKVSFIWRFTWSFRWTFFFTWRYSWRFTKRFARARDIHENCKTTNTCCYVCLYFGPGTVRGAGRSMHEALWLLGDGVWTGVQWWPSRAGPQPVSWSLQEAASVMTGNMITLLDCCVLDFFLSYRLPNCAVSWGEGNGAGVREETQAGARNKWMVPSYLLTELSAKLLNFKKKSVKTTCTTLFLPL